MRTAYGRRIRCVVAVLGWSLLGTSAAQACGWFRPCNGTCGARTAAYYAPTTAYYAPTQALYAPQFTAYAPTTAYYAPTAAAYVPTAAYYAPVAAAAAPQPIVSYMPETHYRSGMVNVPVTLYRPTAAIDPYTGVAVSVLRPTVSYRPVAAAVPYTTYRIMQSPVVAAAAYAPVTSYYAPAPAATCATGSCYSPSTSYYAPSTTSCFSPSATSGYAPSTNYSAPPCATSAACATNSACASGVCPPSASAYPSAATYDSAPTAGYSAPAAGQDGAVPPLRTYDDAPAYGGSTTYSGSTYAPNSADSSSYPTPQTYSRPIDRDDALRPAPDRSQRTYDDEPIRRYDAQRARDAYRDDTNPRNDDSDQRRDSLDTRPLKPVPLDRGPYVPGTGGDETPARESSTGPNLGDPSDKTTALPWDRHRFSRAVLRTQRLEGEVPVESAYDPPGGFSAIESGRGDAADRYDANRFDPAPRRETRSTRYDDRLHGDEPAATEGWRASSR